MNLQNLPPEYIAAIVEKATRDACAVRKVVNRRRYQRRYARIGRALAEGRKP